MKQFLFVMLGGSIGAALRYGASLCASRWLGSALPGTLAVNTLGCLALGAVCALTQERLGCGLSEEARLFLSAGLLGALTTFSTLNLEAFTLFKSGRLGCALAYLSLSFLLGLLATAAGYYAAR
ncbi:MAG: CrcB family protein [Akkermansiaceae bacterium]|nr:CrcB family protein [Akkermansiaceae bacterium]